MIVAKRDHVRRTKSGKLVVPALHPAPRRAPAVRVGVAEAAAPAKAARQR